MENPYSIDPLAKVNQGHKSHDMNTYDTELLDNCMYSESRERGGSGSDAIAELYATPDKHRTPPADSNPCELSIVDNNLYGDTDDNDVMKSSHTDLYATPEKRSIKK